MTTNTIGKLRVSSLPWAVAYALVFVLLLGLAWAVREYPWRPQFAGELLRVDALSALFALLAVAAAALATTTSGNAPRCALAALVLVVSYITTSLPIVVAGYLTFMLLVEFPLAPTMAVQTRTKLAVVLSQGRVLRALLAPICLALGFGALGVGSGAWRYDLPAAGAGFTSLVFWCVLLAALGGGTGLLRGASVWSLLWFYPLLRLYSLGPWNSGWSFATLLVGAAAALWCAWQGVAATQAMQRPGHVVAGMLGLALAGSGFSSAAGVATCCYALICALLLLAGLSPIATTAVGETSAPASPERSDSNTLHPALMLWPLSGALPITAPFVAIWLGVSAALAGGVSLLAAGLWLAGLGNTLAVLRLLREEHQVVAPVATRQLWRSPRAVAAGLSVALGVAAPAVLTWPITPVARQLQGGLTPFGDLVIWPWVGLAVVDAARQPVSSLPSLAVAGLMLVLCALAWLLASWLAGRDSGQ